jgi:TP901 family phage tail tape measure protein
MAAERIDILIAAVNQASSVIKTVKADLAGLGTGAKAAQGGMAKFGASMKVVGRDMAKMGKVMSMAVTLPLALISAAAIKTAAEFEQSMTNAFSVMGDVSRETEADLTSFARTLGKETAFKASEAADAMYKLASAGLDAKEIMGSLDGVLALAAATQSDLAAVAEQTAVAMKVYGLEASDAGRITDTFATGIATSNLTFERISAAMKYAGPTMAAFGKDIEETTAALAVFADVGIFGTKAGSGLRRMMARLADPTAEMTSTFKGLGISLDDVNPATKSLGEMFDTLQKSGIQTDEVFKSFGQISAPAVLAVLRRANDEGRDASAIFAEFEDQMGATGKAAEIAEKQLDTVAGQFKVLKSSVEEVFIAFEEDVLGDSLKGILGDIIGLVNAFGELPKSTKMVIGAVVAVVAALGPVLLIGGKILVMLTAMNPILLAVVAAVTLLTAAWAANAAAQAYVAEVYAESNAAIEAKIEKTQRLADLESELYGKSSEAKLQALEGEKILNAMMEEREERLLGLTDTQRRMAQGAIDQMDAEIAKVRQLVTEKQREVAKHLQTVVDSNGEIFRNQTKFELLAEKLTTKEFEHAMEMLNKREGVADDVNKAIRDGDIRVTKEKIALLDMLEGRDQQYQIAALKLTAQTARERINFMDQNNIADATMQQAILSRRGSATIAEIQMFSNMLDTNLNKASNFSSGLDKILTPKVQEILIKISKYDDAMGRSAQLVQEFQVRAQKAQQALIIKNTTAQWENAIAGFGATPGGGGGGGAGGGKSAAEQAVDDFKELEDQLNKSSASFGTSMDEISGSIERGLSGEVVEEVTSNYDDLNEILSEVEDNVATLTKVHEEFIQEAVDGLDAYEDNLKAINDEFDKLASDTIQSAAQALAEDFGEALEKETELLDELKEAKKELSQADSEDKASAKERVDGIQKELDSLNSIKDTFESITADGADFTEALSAANLEVETLLAKQKELEESGASTTANALALADAQQQAAILLGQQKLAEEGLATIEAQRIEDKAKASLSDAEFQSYLLGKELQDIETKKAAEIKALNEVKAVQEAIKAGKVDELDLSQFESEAALKLAEEAIVDEEIFRAGLLAQEEILQDARDKEAEIFKISRDEILAQQLSLEKEQLASYDRIIVKLNAVASAAMAAFRAQQKVSGGGGRFEGGFARGGYTGGGDIHKVAGVVHKGEWVAPNWMVKNFRPMFSQLEGMRRNKVKGFEEGGEVGGSTINNNTPVTMNNTITNEVDFNSVARSFAWIMNTG